VVPTVEGEEGEGEAEAGGGGGGAACYEPDWWLGGRGGHFWGGMCPVRLGEMMGFL
jgi:hypothetical protein